MPFFRLFSAITWWTTSGWKSTMSSAASWTSCSTSLTGSPVSIDCRRYSPLK